MKIKTFETEITENGIVLTIDEKECSVFSPKVGINKFQYGRVIKRGDRKLDGIVLTEEEITHVKEERETIETRSKEETEKFLTSCKSVEYYNGVWLLEGAREFKETLEAEWVFYDMRVKFIDENRKFFVKSESKTDNYDVKVIYNIVNEIEVIEKEYERDLTKEEDKNFKKGDIIDEMVVCEETRAINDIDYGKMDKCFKVLKKITKKTIVKKEEVRNMEELEMVGKRWAEVKSMLEDEMTVDNDNVDEDGNCIVDFEKYVNLSVSGKIIDNYEIVINDDEIIYDNRG